MKGRERPNEELHRKVLEMLRDWDPIGVISEDHQDEYESYAAAIVRLLDGGRDAVKLADHLGRIRVVSIGLSDSESERQKDIEIARRLVDWWQRK